MNDNKQVLMLVGAALLGWAVINFQGAYDVRESDPAVFYQVIGAAAIGAFLVWNKVKDQLLDLNEHHPHPAHDTQKPPVPWQTPEEYAAFLEEARLKQSEIHESKDVRDAQCKLNKDMEHVIKLAPTLSDSNPPQTGADLWDSLTSLVRKVNYANVHRADDHD